MGSSGPEIEQLIQLMARLPGLGPRSARRAVLHLIKKKDTLMAPLSALCVLLLYDFLATRGVACRRATALALLFGFGTPVLFRTAHLNHNMFLMQALFGLEITPEEAAERQEAATASFYGE